ncbi:MAG: GAF domain-containing protein [Anaerolineales bacterium]|nr:GAF domain-containing protein [Anaerolineales bacterium]
MNNRKEELQPLPPESKVNTFKPSSSEERNALYIAYAFIIAGIPSIGIFLYYGMIAKSWQIEVIAGILVIVSFIAFLMTFLIRNGKHIQAMTVISINVTLTFISIPLLVQGLGVISALSVIIFLVAITSLAMPSRFALPGFVGGVLTGLAVFFLDNAIRYQRFVVPQQLQALTPYVSIGLLLFFIVVTIGQFNKYTLRVKIALGILATGGIIIATLTFFGVTQASQLINLLTNQYEKESRARINQEIIATVANEAEIANNFFDGILNDLEVVANVRVDLEKDKALFIEGPYWNASTRVFQLSGGQYGNSTTDVSSVFIPSTIVIDEALLADLNTTAYLDFYAPSFLSAHPEVASLYYINTAGATTYYPNINLAQNVPPDFDPRKEFFYTIADPQNDPAREPRWTDAYLDPAGQGLIVTLSIPVYKNSSFQGVMATDIQLAKISERIANIKPGETGYAFLVDSTGHILSMPEQGYKLYEIQPEELGANDFPRLSVLVKGSFDLQEATSRIVNGETNLAEIQVNNEASFIAFAPLKTPNYRLAVVAPESEFTGEIVKATSETTQRVEGIIRSSVIILAFLFIGALLISLWIGQLITSPLVRLTKTVDAISKGDLSARATVGTEDETGRLAAAFNTMTERLNSTLLGLEQRIADRTTDLERANKNNERRATQFESIARIAQIISTTESNEELLPRIAEVISQQFDFYHVGIFLLDVRKEFAVLTASNSEGGKRMLARNHRLPINENSIVGYASKSGQPRLALDTDIDSVYSTNPDLSRTRSEIALPLIVGNEVIGVLDVQSQEKNAFGNEDINIMSTLARQVSIAIQNARSYQQTREALNRAENASMELSKQNWRQFTNQREINGVVFDGVNTKNLSKNGAETAHNLAIPLMLRGAKIGSIKLNSIDPQRVWTEDEIALLQAAADRTTLAIENARLLQDAQKRASKERTIGEISSKISGLVNIENILETAIKELGTTMPNTDISIQFSEEDSEQSAGLRRP